MSQPEKKTITLSRLWKEFLPLSLSDVTMMVGDPAITTTLAHLPDSRVNLAAIGVGKSIAIFVESPIIMLLHAANTLGASRAARAALFRFMLIAIGALGAFILFLAVPFVFGILSALMGIDGEIARRAQWVLVFMSLWPTAIGWRRYFQGLLIYFGHGQAVARSSLFRLGIILSILVVGYALKVDGFLLGGTALVASVIAEAAIVTFYARAYGVRWASDIPTEDELPKTLSQVWRFYWPLANTMLVVWGGRVVLMAVIARAWDGTIALAAWPAAWGLVLLVGNSTRMVQQVTIRYFRSVSKALLFRFTLSVGLTASTILVLLALTPWGRTGVAAFLGKDPLLIQSVVPVLIVSSLIPLLIAFQNARQGILIAQSKTGLVNAATWVGTFVLLVSAAIFISCKMSGAMAAATAMLLALSSELACLSWLSVKKH